ncbi:hypothetical protein GE107_15805 [Cohnella sp. CFH 77786]|uniref:hypothetical protein n=1 Tax=Cohnella sp. CFH 77786 TaxID=2662265 RepID=UPI001C60EF28|nr:hypothetical protein [Cohnella sp. CFH 77786]MBW5447523.1 hypothetical protein [Cohnella sp. CFH 77786]
MNVKSRRQSIVFGLFAAVFVALFIFMDAGVSRGDPDTYWHIELGKEMIRQHRVIDTAIHTFAGESLPYVPHEVGFQLIVGSLYNAGEWKAIHLFTLFSVFLLAWGLYRLMEVSRQEMDLPRMHPFLVYVVLPFLLYFIYLVYFHIRPQMISAGLVVWFAVWLRRFALHAGAGKALVLGLLSWVLANVHTGVWPVVFVLLTMHMLDNAWSKKLVRYDWLAAAGVIAGGLANFGGWRSLTYFAALSNSPFTKWINEWQPISYSGDGFAFAGVILFILSAMYSLTQRPFRPFRFLLFIGMMYLGLSSYKQFLFLLLFLPYYAAPAIDRFKRLQLFGSPEAYIRPKVVLPLLTLGLAVNFTAQMFQDVKDPASKYPVEEMDYILQAFPSSERPKVLSTYTTSGYVLFRGGDVLADGRFDPFILDPTRGVHGWTAFERSVNGFRSEYLMDVVRSDKPDYLIIPMADADPSANTLQLVALKEVVRQLPKPVFKGSYGLVWDLRGRSE